MAKINGLTQKQEAFCNYIIAGYNGIESYQKAYNSNNKNVANVESTKLLKRDDITKRIQELHQPIINHNQNIAISERKQQIEFIKERIRICKQKDDEQSIIRYTDMLNKIHALYKDTETNKTEDTAVQNLSVETLQKLSKAL